MSTADYYEMLAKQNMHWQPADTAPKDGTVFIALPQTDMYEGGFAEYYFENTFEKPKELIAWMPMPEVA
jgi:hypothetical protein